MHRKLSTFIFIVLLCCTVFLARQLQLTRQNLPPYFSSPVYTFLNPQIIGILGGDFKGVLSDYLLLQASYYTGGISNPDKVDWQIPVTLFKAAQQLDPLSFSIPYYAEGTMAWVNGQTENANSILKISHIHRSWDWRPGFYLGFNLFHLLGNNKLAAHYLSESGKRPYAPAMVPFLAAKMLQSTGKTELSIVLLQTMLLNTDKEDKMYREIEKRIEAYRALSIIEKALQQYKEEHLTFPKQLHDLVQTSFLKKIPTNPYNKQFFYDPVKGTVFFFPSRENNSKL